MHVNFRTKKRFGQHFLVDQQIIDLITKHINAKSDDLIVEIGPGNGAITEPLAQSKAMMHLIEFDRELIPILQKKFASYANTKIHHEDALKFNYSLLGQKLRLVGNLPYNISTPLLFHLSSTIGSIKNIEFNTLLKNRPKLKAYYERSLNDDILKPQYTAADVVTGWRGARGEI